MSTKLESVGNREIRGQEEVIIRRRCGRRRSNRTAAIGGTVASGRRRLLMKSTAQQLTEEHRLTPLCPDLCSIYPFLVLTFYSLYKVPLEANLVKLES